MKCPKCGSDITKTSSLEKCKSILCDWIRVYPSQQRLERVLSKMEKVHENNFNYDLKENWCLHYSNQKFMLIVTSEICIEYSFLENISLNTVESLLKDLGVDLDE